MSHVPKLRLCHWYLSPQGGYTALIAAAKAQNTVLVKFLCFRKAKIDVQNTRGRTALHYAAIHGNENLTILLNTYGAKSGICDKVCE